MYIYLHKNTHFNKMISHLQYNTPSSKKLNAHYSKLLYLLKKNKISHNVEEKCIVLIFNLERSNAKIMIYYDEYKPEYIVSETDNVEIMRMCENINMNIDKYDYIEDIALKFIQDINETIVNTDLDPIHKKKDYALFAKILDDKKNKYIASNTINPKEQIPKYSKAFAKSNLFSTRICIEMFGDQLLKLYSDDRFNVSVENFPNVQIYMGNFYHINKNTNIKKNIKKMSEDLFVTIDMSLDLEYYNSAPKINLSSNKVLKDNILQIICRLKPFTDINSWSIKYSIYDSVVNIHNMINTFGKVEREQISELDGILNELEYLVRVQKINISDAKLLEIFDKDFGKDLNKNIAKTPDDKSNKEKIFWKEGTRYGHNGSSKWDIDEYVANLSNKKNNTDNKFNAFLNYLSDSHNNFSLLETSVIERVVNVIITYIKNESDNISIILPILDIVSKNIGVLMNIENTKKLIGTLKNLTEEHEIIHEFFSRDVVGKILEKNNKAIMLNPFEEIFSKYTWIMHSNTFNSFNTFASSKYPKLKNIKPEQLTRIKKEFNIIKKSITICENASMFFCVEKNDLNKMRFIISGPMGTPYENGLYIFDMVLSNEFPQTPPLVHFSNNGGKRFNPNLYDCGKVCLSLLGT